MQELTGLNQPQIKDVLNQKDKLETQQIVFLIERIYYYIKEVKLATNQHLWLEVGMIDLSNMTENSTLLDLQNRVRALEGGVVSQPVQAIQVVSKPAPVTPPASVYEPVARPAVQQAEPIQQAPKPQVAREEFTAPPMSKKPDGNDINSLWQALLANLNNQPARAILNLATPLKIAPDGIVLTFKNDINVNRLNNDNAKKELIAKSAKILFDKDDIPLTIRVAQSGDVVEQPTVAPAQTPRQVEVKPQAQEQQVKVQNSQPIKKDVVQENVKDAKEIERMETDQEKMVLDLFDGKYVE